jgi:hypothetical protein
VREFLLGMLSTAELVLFALFPSDKVGSAPHEAAGAARRDSGAGEVLSCTPRQIGENLDRLLDDRGELGLFFPHCRAIAAPVVMFRLKRRGFSRCSIEASDQGLLVRGRR